MKRNISLLLGVIIGVLAAFSFSPKDLRIDNLRRHIMGLVSGPTQPLRHSTFVDQCSIFTFYTGKEYRTGNIHQRMPKVPCCFRPPQPPQHSTLFDPCSIFAFQHRKRISNKEYPSANAQGTLLLQATPATSTFDIR